MVLKKGSQIDDKMISNLEILLESKLPSDYKSFIFPSNPIELESHLFKNDISSFYIDKFYSAHCNDDLNIFTIYENQSWFFECKFLPFAYDSGGWQFVICIEQGENYGKVYFCRMDEELDKALTLLANNFEEFINNLKSPDEHDDVQ